MKKTILSILFSATFVLSGCQSQLILNPQINDISSIVSGNWENTLKKSDGSGVNTELEIKEIENSKTDKYKKTFSAIMSSNLIGNESETLKLTTKNINISGLLEGQTLRITDIESESDSIKANSYFTVSEDGKFLTLNPGEVKFHKK